MTDNPKHIHDTNEQYTPVDITDKARRVMKRIDLDPASSTAANSRVCAAKIFTSADGVETFSREWQGRVWMNPPGGTKPVLSGVSIRSNPALFWEKLVYEWDQLNVEMAIVLGFTLEVLQTTQRSRHPMLKFPMCVPKNRLVFDTPREARMEALRSQLQRAKQLGKSDEVKKAIRKKLAVVEAAPEQSLVPGDQPTHCNVLVFVPPKTEQTLSGWEGRYVSRFKKIFSTVGFVRV